VDHFVPDIGRFYSLASIWKEDAAFAGSETLLASPDLPPEPADLPPPPPPAPDDRRPLLVVADGRGRVTCWNALRTTPFWRDAVALACSATPLDHLESLRARRVGVIETPGDHVDLRRALEILAADYGVHTVRVDSGGTLNGAFLRAGLVDEVSLLIHPVLVGGASPRSMFRAPDLGDDATPIPLHLLACEQLDGGLLWLRYAVAK
jgi:2,5-diamino-6-(ribosylamino)-4(3H)-pyrimidinone 5'-phosphate reductase